MRIAASADYPHQFTALDNISAHIGSLELRKICYDAILCHWASFHVSQGVVLPLSIDDIVIKNKQGVVLHPPVDRALLERDVILSEFYKPSGKGGILKFKKPSAPFVVHVVPIESVWRRLEEMIEEADYQRQVARGLPDASSSTGKAGASKKGTKSQAAVRKHATSAGFRCTYHTQYSLKTVIHLDAVLVTM